IEDVGRSLKVPGAAERRPIVARGGAKRNPWRTASPHLATALEGRKNLSPFQGSLIVMSPHTRGCAALHPWLPSVAPFGGCNRIRSSFSSFPSVQFPLISFRSLAPLRLRWIALGRCRFGGSFALHNHLPAIFQRL